MGSRIGAVAIALNLVLASCSSDSSSPAIGTESSDAPTTPSEKPLESLPPCEAQPVESLIPEANYRYRHCPVEAGDLPQDFLENGLWLANAERNIPQRKPEFHVFFGDSITSEWRGDVMSMTEILIDNLGGYDRWVHAAYEDDGNATNQALVNGLDELGYFEHNFDYGATPAFALVNERAGCLGGFSGGPNPVRDAYSFCNDRLAISNSDNLEFYGLVGTKYLMLTGLIHEYHHHVQRAHLLGKEGAGGNGPGAPVPPDGFGPTWWIEGTAQLTPGWILRDYFDEFEVTKDNGLSYDEIVASDDVWPSPKFKLKSAIAGSCCGWFEDEFLSYVKMMEAGGFCSEVDARQESNHEEYVEKCGVAHWHLMARYLMHITSPEIAMVSILEDAWRLGWHGSFKKHVGMTMDEFYGEYESFMKSYDLAAGAPEWIYPPKTPFKNALDFWSIKSGPQE